MKKYKRLTYKSNGIIFSRALNEEEILNRLAELEDKIESEELINFKQAVKNFTEKLKKYFYDLYKTEYANKIVDDLITELYGADE